MSKIVLTGISSGLGAALARKLFGGANYLIGVDKEVPERRVPYTDFYNYDISVEGSAIVLCRKLGTINYPVEILINCAGINRLDHLENVSVQDWDHIMNTNARAAFILTQCLLPQLKQSQGTILNIISNASHVPMTASLAYNASKAALAMMTRQMARELTRRHGITVFGIEPGKIAGTNMSKYVDKRVPEVRGWTPEYAAKYHRDSVLMKQDIDVDTLAEFIAFLLSKKERHQWLSGCLIPYGA
jgi:NAD(P)-dependent dehydrogenase (short-subunit alcohol dehydrogenase family)